MNRDVLAWLVANTTINFANYDNWRFDSDYNHTNTPDGRVDMIFLMYRYINDTLKIRDLYGNWTGIAQLGEGQANLYTNNYNSNGQQVYISLQRLTSGNASGVTIARSWIDFNVIAHEFGHYLFGAIHYLGSGIMGQVFKPAMSSLERQQLGYMTISDASDGTIAIPDYLTSNVAYRVPISGSSEYFVVENHQKLSIYDGVGGTVDCDPRGKGLYVFRNIGSLSTRIQCADGRWNWHLDCQPPNPFGPTSTVNIWSQLDPNPNSGQNEIEIGKLFREGACPATVNDYTGEAQGDNEDAFNLGYNQLISPWGNPNTNTTGGAQTDRAIEVLSQNGSTTTARVYLGNAISAPPSKPQYLRGSYAGNGQVSLTWAANIEPDMSQYRIYRNGQLVQTINHPTSSSTDVVLSGGTYTYKMKALDTQAKESVFSDSVIVVVPPFPPSAPQNLTHVLVAQGSSYRPKLLWRKNPEADMSGYDLHRWTSEDGYWQKIATRNHPDTTYVDVEIIVSALGRNNTNEAQYKVQAFNTSLQYSPFSNLDYVSYWIEAKPVPGDIAEISAERPTQFVLYPNYPNPFNPSTIIRYALPVDSYVRLKIYNILGQEVASLVDGIEEAGFKSASLDASRLPSGLYFYRIQAGAFTETKKLLLVR